jgi:hypothetical protein
MTGIAMASVVTIAHLSDLHFGGYADLKQIEALEEFLPTLSVTAIVVSGDLSQRARHGEFQAAHVFLHRMRLRTPALIVPGNHDIEWWRSPLGLLGEKRKYAKYLRYYNELRPVLEVPGAVLAGALSSYGVAFGTLTTNRRDLALKGHQPPSVTKRVQKLFEKVPPGVAKVLVLHHNVLAGGTGRMGLARWRDREGGGRFVIRFELDASNVPLPRISTERFVLHATPAINLFPHDAEPVLLDNSRGAVRIRPARSKGGDYQIHSIDRVIGHGRGTNAKQEFRPIGLFDPADQTRPVYQASFQRSDERGFLVPRHRRRPRHGHRQCRPTRSL